MRIVRWASGLLAGEAIKLWLFPILPVVGAAVIGFAQGVHWFYLCVGVAVTGAAVTTWLVRFDEWKHRNSATNKFVFHGGYVNRDINAVGQSIGVRFGFHLQNLAFFPIQWRVAELRTEFEGEYPPNKGYEKKEFESAPGTFGYFTDHTISISPRPEGYYVGKMSVRIEFGRNKRFDNILSFDKRIRISVNAIGDIYWHEWADQ